MTHFFLIAYDDLTVHYQLFIIKTMDLLSGWSEYHYRPIDYLHDNKLTSKLYTNDDYRKMNPIFWKLFDHYINRIFIFWWKYLDVLRLHYFSYFIFQIEKIKWWIQNSNYLLLLRNFSSSLFKVSKLDIS